MSETLSSSSSDTVATDVFIAGSSIREPNTGREATYKPYEASPLEDYRRDPKVLEHQDEVEAMQQALIDSNPEVPVAARRLIRHQFLAATALRDLDNQRGYDFRLMALPLLELSDQDIVLHGSVLSGVASIEDIYTHMVLTGRSSAELARLRTFYTNRHEHRTTMMAEIADLTGHTIEPSNPYQMEVTQVDAHFLRGNALKALAIRTKSLLTKMDDGTKIKSREDIIIRTDAAVGFPKQTRETIEDAARHDVGHVARLGRIRPLLKDIVTQGALHPFAIATQTSIYASNSRTVIAVRARQAESDRRRLAPTQMDSSELIIVRPSDHVTQ